MPYVQHTGPFDVARVAGVSDTRRTYLTYPTGKTGYFDNTSDHDFADGDVVFVDADTGYVEPAPDDVWPDSEWVGVVKHRTAAETVVEMGGRLVLLETNDVKYEVNNTVVARESIGVVRVLTETPIRAIDLGLHDEPDIERRFRMDATGGPSFEDYAGMEPTKRRAKELIELPLAKRDKLERIGAKPVRGSSSLATRGLARRCLPASSRRRREQRSIS